MVFLQFNSKSIAMEQMTQDGVPSDFKGLFKWVIKVNHGLFNYRNLLDNTNGVLWFNRNDFRCYG